MASSPNGPLAGNPSPFTPTDSVDFSSFSTIFESKSDDMATPQTDTGVPPGMSSFLSSMKSAAPTRPFFTTITTDGTTTISEITSTATSDSDSSGSGSGSISNSAVTATATATTSIRTTTSAVATSAAANNASADSLQQESVLSKPGIQAAIAVPIIVVVLALLAIIFCCVRRRRKRKSAAEDIAEKQPPEGARKKKWTRHLRVFSFDNELLMGGRYSSTNSIRSRQTGSMRSTTRSQAQTPSVASIHSVEEEIAPPYRDAVHTAHPSISQVMTGAAVGGVAAAGVNRSASSATAPPPYASGGARAAVAAAPSPSPSPGAGAGARNPFLDTPPISPVDDSRSPFNDPPGTTPALSRNSSLFQASRDDVSSIGGASDAASIREATLARNASVRDGGRVIQNVREGSQSSSQNL